MRAREVAHHRHGVRDEQVGQAEVALQLRQQVDDLRAYADVERGDRFVADNELGTQREGAGDSDALALSAGELVRVAVAGGFVEAHRAQQFGDAWLGISASSGLDCLTAVDDQRLGDDVSHPEARDRAKRTGS